VPAAKEEAAGGNLSEVHNQELHSDIEIKDFNLNTSINSDFEKEENAKKLKIVKPILLKDEMVSIKTEHFASTAPVATNLLAGGHSTTHENNNCLSDKNISLTAATNLLAGGHSTTHENNNCLSDENISLTAANSEESLKNIFSNKNNPELQTTTTQKFGIPSDWKVKNLSNINSLPKQNSKHQNQTARKSTTQSKCSQISYSGAFEDHKNNNSGDDDDLKVIEETHSYRYFCLDCETEREGDTRVPLTQESLDSHKETKGHSRTELIQDKVGNVAVPVFNINFSHKWNKRVGRDWKRQFFCVKRLQMSGQYSAARPCLHPACTFTAGDAADMFKHIHHTHIAAGQ